MAEQLQLIKVMKDEKFGRYLVADQVLKKGTRIYTDVPFVIGPKSDSPPVCLGCHRIWKKKYYCSKCSWPCCNIDCEKSSTHSEYECQVFSAANVLFQDVDDSTQPCLQYDCITPLRMLLAKEKNPNRWNDEVNAMEDHNVDRKKRSRWEADDINITKYLLGPCGLIERFSEEMVQKVCGILEVNSVEIPLHVGPNIRGIYPYFAIMSHNCVPSVVHTIVSGGKDGIPENFVEIWAATDIAKGGRLEICYTQVLQCTLHRRDHLWNSKFFYCDCDRCADPTELGTHLSSIKCNVCDTGIVMTVNSLDVNSEWKCSECNYITTSANVTKVIDTIQQEMIKTETQAFGSDEVDKREQDLKWYGNILHPNHALLASTKYTLAQQYGRVPGYMLDKMTISQLKRKMEICKQLLELLNVISPGQTRMRGMMLYELQAPSIIMARLECKDMKFTKRMSKIVEILHESAEILSREDENSEKGAIGRAAMKFYKEAIQKL